MRVILPGHVPLRWLSSWFYLISWWCPKKFYFTFPPTQHWPLHSSFFLVTLSCSLYLILTIATLRVEVSSLTWLLALTKSFAWLVSRVVGLFYTPQEKRGCKQTKYKPLLARLLFNNYSPSPNGLWVNSPWGRRAIDSEAMRARGINVLVKSN